jgi:membrane-associated phospholipid phosphatase
MPTSALYQEQLIPALRARTFTRVDLGALRGLVCAPSFHTVCAVLYILTAWPIKKLRWWLVGLNIVMLLAVPVEGTHYLTDMIAGMLVALFATFVIRTAIHRYRPAHSL